jgi:hypothetical protein
VTAIATHTATAISDQYLPKRSQAPKLWLVVAAIVLLVIFAETRTSGQCNSNLFLNGDSESVGGIVYVDGTRLGKITSANNSGLSGGAFWCHLSNGYHLLEIKKPGYKTFSKSLDFKRQDYLGVSLEH